MIDADSRFKLSQVRSVQLLEKNNLTIFPNPVAQTIYLMMDAEKSGMARMTLTDLSGRTLENRSWRVNQGQNSLQWPVQNLPSGNYLIQLELDGNRQRQMIRKQ
ncbi:MAG: T9SS type A sorting domain-containing protein [Ferruginibacter sp.]